MTEPATPTAATAAGDPVFLAAVKRVDEALGAIGLGDPAPFQACWATTEDCTLYGAFGTRERGATAVFATLGWVGSRFAGGSLVPEYEVIASTESFGYTVGLERGVLHVDGAPSHEMVIRVTHIYRLFDEGWKLVHRHGDHPPARESAVQA